MGGCGIICGPARDDASARTHGGAGARVQAAAAAQPICGYRRVYRALRQRRRPIGRERVRRLMAALGLQRERPA
ncbi:MAG: IS3 family transposase [Candidatus Competibacteraceae bacterium]|nr:IS3 family transposase [Candidatus Competibacteraceae bacterium]